MACSQSHRPWRAVALVQGLLVSRRQRVQMPSPCWPQRKVSRCGPKAHIWAAGSRCWWLRCRDRIRTGALVHTTFLHSACPRPAAHAASAPSVTVCVQSLMASWTAKVSPLIEPARRNPDGPEWQQLKAWPCPRRPYTPRQLLVYLQLLLCTTTCCAAPRLKVHATLPCRLGRSAALQAGLSALSHACSHPQMLAPWGAGPTAAACSASKRSRTPCTTAWRSASTSSSAPCLGMQWYAAAAQPGWAGACWLLPPAGAAARAWHCSSCWTFACQLPRGVGCPCSPPKRAAWLQVRQAG